MARSLFLATSTLVLAFAQAAAGALRGNLSGAYLHGSLARGSFHRATSDIDILLVTQEPCGEDALAGVEAAYREAGAPIDLVVVTQAQLALDALPVPVEFLIKPGGEHAGRALHIPQGRMDFPLDRQDAHDCGMDLLGPPAREAIPPVPWELLAESLRWLFPHVAPRFKNPTLMLCRTLHAFATRTLAGKSEAGRWAAGTLDPEWRCLIDAALDAYAAGVPETSDPQELRRFERCCAELVHGSGKDGRPYR